jgi:hypothetical protein
VTSEKPEWFELSEGGDQSSTPRRAKKKLPFIVALAAGVAILGGSLLANAHDEPNASASTIAISTPGSTPNTAASSSAPSVAGAPAIAPVPQSTVSNRRGEGEHGDGNNRDGERRDD